MLPTLLVSILPRATYGFFFFFNTTDLYIHVAKIGLKQLNVCHLRKQNQNPELLGSVLQFGTVPLNGLTGTSRA